MQQPPNSLLGLPPPNAQNIYGMASPPHLPEPSRNMPPPQAEWRTMDMVQGQYYGGFPGPNNNGNHNMMPMPEQLPGVNMRPRMMHDNFRPPMHNGPPRGMGRLMVLFLLTESYNSAKSLIFVLQNLAFIWEVRGNSSIFSEMFEKIKDFRRNVKEIMLKIKCKMVFMRLIHSYQYIKFSVIY